MAKNNKADMSCARVKKYTASDVSKAERHNERKNETYENMNVIEERIPYNVHFKKPFAPTYMEQLKQMETDGMVSLRGLRKDATLFNEIVIDVNTMYFERNGGYEYGCVNNVPQKPRRIGGRWSVLDRLHIKQAERRQKDNTPQQEQERSRKS